MTKREIEKIKIEKRWTFKIMDIFEKYFFAIFPLGLLLVSFFVTASGFENNINNEMIGGLISFCCSFYASIFVVKKLYENQIFKTFIITNLTTEKIENALLKSGFDNFKYYKTGYFEVVSNVSWFSWGEKIIIIQNGDEILINSRPSNQPITLSMDKNNIRKIINQLQQMESFE